MHHAADHDVEDAIAVRMIGGRHFAVGIGTHRHGWQLDRAEAKGEPEQCQGRSKQNHREQPGGDLLGVFAGDHGGE